MHIAWLAHSHDMLGFCKSEHVTGSEKIRHIVHMAQCTFIVPHVKNHIYIKEPLYWPLLSPTEGKHKLPRPSFRPSWLQSPLLRVLQLEFPRAALLDTSNYYRPRPSHSRSQQWSFQPHPPLTPTPYVRWPTLTLRRPRRPTSSAAAAWWHHQCTTTPRDSEVLKNWIYCALCILSCFAVTITAVETCWQLLLTVTCIHCMWELVGVYAMSTDQPRISTKTTVCSFLLLRHQRSGSRYHQLSSRPLCHFKRLCPNPFN